MAINTEHVLGLEEGNRLIHILKVRFEGNMNRHKHVKWPDVEVRLATNSQKLWSLNEMERSNGEPDVIGYDENTGAFIFVDCVAESPKGRRSLCYDREALESRKAHKPANSVIDVVHSMGVELLTEEEYSFLQELGKFDLKTSSWIKTPHAIRELGGALFCDCRYNKVFVYHNGADSYYAARGFRASLRV